MGFDVLGAQPDRIVVLVAQLSGERPVQDQRPGALRIGRRELDRDETPGGHSEDRRLLGSDRVEHDPRVFHPLFDVDVNGPVREAHPALVEEDQAAERGQPAHQASRPCRPPRVEVGDVPGHDDEVERPVAHHLVGEVDPILGSRVPDPRDWLRRRSRQGTAVFRSIRDGGLVNRRGRRDGHPRSR
jgi:hypothetical protein